jgi:hypothetical protein
MDKFGKYNVHHCPIGTVNSSMMLKISGDL